jgi:hypothetical protein
MTSDPVAAVMLYMRGMQISKVLSVSAELSFADHIGQTPRPSSEIAREIGADPEMLLRLARACGIRNFLCGSRGQDRSLNALCVPAVGR